ncbi:MULTISPECIES: DUF885 domain-containing protein [unclassified Shewanella]|uniref:DUF885 domain-containing protein n=1 Tax=unclassified Shewanella TaxID=196818 RepID=UPI000C8174D3|nr:MULTISPECIES: DUF885 domain-containing protein [unclassified Shewanella]MDO6639216.1 DUF885 domain-containing protein [Shewanella sp. 5_MG-2023]MDO6680340.1 DUF885 domain-containing protein [Shewanella sp. 4_MG-2023]PMH84370.1 hypothetical protein BCU57_17950 [Shewanella sp. 10N.286.48.B5]PMI02867.1 hypothetical protein BCU55_04620 [Shewanella sp. 10N.286.48.A6]
MRLTTKTTLIAVALTSLLSNAAIAHTAGHQPLTNTVASTKTATTESEKANELFESMFMENVMASPISQTYLRIKTDYDKWGDFSDKSADEDLARAKKHLKQLETINVAKLDKQTALSYKLMKQGLEQQISDDKWRYHNYPVNQMRGSHSFIATFLINQHQVENVSDAQAYISRLNGVKHVTEQVIDALKIRADKNIIAPKFVFPYVISDSENIIKGAPFTDTEVKSTLWGDINRKIEKLDITQAQKDELLAAAKTALIKSVKPGYDNLISYLHELEAKADSRDGVWKLPLGEDFYNTRLNRITTTDMSSETIHQLGLAEVERIHNEMRAIMKKVNYTGNLAEFMAFMRDDEQFYYPNTDEGKTRYITEAKDLIDNMESRLGEVFNIKPKAGLIVKPVEAFREKSAGKAFYDQPAPDGSRPGTYYANLYDMKAMPTYQMEALAYHEGIPGHHMQIAIAQELEGIPKFRKFGGYTAYIEGWGLYTEYFPKEMGLYADPYSDFGRLAMELWRACRLVVDTGIHTQQWTREQGIQYYVDNTPNAKSDAIKMVERHVVMPGQATAYKVGMIKVLELRENAKLKLGDKFDIRQFHTLVLQNGPVPLDVLEAEVDNWINQTNKPELLSQSADSNRG